MSDATYVTLVAGTLVTLAATSGSLYLGLDLKLTPYDLCWYQRILMYPLVTVLEVTAVEDRPDAWKTMFPLSPGDLALSAYHPYLRAAPGATCTVGDPCTSVQYSMLGGLLTISRLALIGSTFMTILMVAVVRVGGETGDTWGI